MCGRFARFTDRKTFAQLAGLPVDPDRPFGETIPSWNVAPSQACALVRCKLDAQPELDNLLWGLIPHWAEARPDRRPINARIETAAEKPMFRRIFRFRRCLVASDGWYEWREEAGGKQPYFLCRADRQPFFFAGVWDEWTGPDGIVPTFAILTRPAIASLAAIHDRMPSIVAPEHYAAWLDKATTEPGAIAALCPEPGPSDLVAYRVSRAVNRAEANSPELIAPAG